MATRPIFAHASYASSKLPFAAMRAASLVLLLTAAAGYQAFHLEAFRTGDLWWHLRTGLWILNTHSFPASGIFSRFAERPWADVSWGYDLLIAFLYQWKGIRIFPALLIVFRAAIAVSTFGLAYARRQRFWASVLLSCMAQYVIVDLQPLPTAISIVLFAAELALLLQVRAAENLGPMRWLPVLLFVWANLNGQFLVGVVATGIFLFTELADWLLRRDGQPLKRRNRVAKVCGWVGLSIAATLLNPYGLRIYGEALQALYSKVLLSEFQEMMPMNFRRPEHFVFMLLVMSAFLALGWQRSRDIFKIALLTVAIALAFRVQRDLWCAALVAIGILADALPEREPASAGTREPKWLPAAVAIISLLVLGACFTLIPNIGILNAQITRVFPVQACDYIRSNRTPGPLFNAYVWGGFVMWYMPETPVSIDGRINLYGDEITRSHLEVASGKTRFEKDSMFMSSRTILVQTDSSLATALMTIPVLQEQFDLAYQDKVASVFVRK